MAPAAKHPATFIASPPADPIPWPMFRRRSRITALLAFATLVVLNLWGWEAGSSPMERLAEIKEAAYGKGQTWGKSEVDEAMVTRKVPLEIHIMSKCPDAEMCLSDMILPAMMKVNELVDFKLSFIGALSEDDGGVLCKHGPTECMGNIIELCAFELYQDPKIALGFTMCITRDFAHIPERALVQDCALEHGMDFERLNECTTREDGAHGINMLRRSVQETAAANITKSCTVRVDNEVYCIADGGFWTDCPKGYSVDTLVKTVEELAQKLR